MKNYVYLVIHDGPCGSLIVGAYMQLKNAEKAKTEWDLEHKHAWDKAVIVKKEINDGQGN